MIETTGPKTIDYAVEAGVIAGMLAGFRDEMIAPETFMRKEFRQVCEAIYDMDERGLPVNIVTLVSFLRDHDGPDHTFVASLPLEEPVSRADFDGIVSRHLEFVGRRQVLRLHQKTHSEIEQAESGVERQVIADSYREQIEEINLKTDRQVRTKTVRELALGLIQEIEDKSAGRIESSFIPTGIPRLDDLLGGGLEPGRLIVVGARPGRGKSALGMDLIYHAAMAQQKRTLFFSLEMPAQQVMRRFLALGSGVPVGKIARPEGGRLTVGDFQKVIKTAQSWVECGDLLSLDCRPGLTASEICSTAKRHFIKPEILLVDYLQIVQPDRRRENRLAEVTDISAAFLALKKELNIPIVVLAQLNRESVDRRPRPSDLRESGAIEQDADQIILIDWKPDTETDHSVEVDLIVGKNRDGSEGVVSAIYDKPQLKFRQLDRDDD